MAVRKNPVAGTWLCPYCHDAYTSPIPVADVWHPCPARKNDTRHLHPKEETTK